MTLSIRYRLGFWIILHEIQGNVVLQLSRLLYTGLQTLNSMIIHCMNYCFCISYWTIIIATCTCTSILKCQVPTNITNIFLHYNYVPVFAPLNELIMRLPEEKLYRWERLWMVSDRRTNRIHPLVYAHPITGLKVVYKPCFTFNTRANNLCSIT